jgi:hypothetical protein
MLTLKMLSGSRAGLKERFHFIVRIGRQSIFRGN